MYSRVLNENNTQDFYINITKYLYLYDDIYDNFRDEKSLRTLQEYLYSDSIEGLGENIMGVLENRFKEEFSFGVGDRSLIYSTGYDMEPVYLEYLYVVDDLFYLLDEPLNIADKLFNSETNDFNIVKSGELLKSFKKIGVSKKDLEYVFGDRYETSSEKHSTQVVFEMIHLILNKMKWKDLLKISPTLEEFVEQL